jgi:hypothetical protein
MQLPRIARAIGVLVASALIAMLVIVLVELSGMNVLKLAE